MTLPAIILIGLWFALQLFDGVASLSNVQQGMEGVAYLAHVGGFVTGLGITLLVRPRIKPPATTSNHQLSLLATLSRSNRPPKLVAIARQLALAIALLIAHRQDQPMCNRHPQHQHGHVSSRPAPATSHRSHLTLIPLEKLFSGRDNILVYHEKSSSSIHHSDDPFDHVLDDPQVDSLPQRRLGPDDPHWKIPSLGSPYF